MAVDFTDIDKNLPDGQNMGGIPQLVYFALQSDVLSWPTPTLKTLLWRKWEL